VPYGTSGDVSGDCCNSSGYEWSGPPPFGANPLSACFPSQASHESATHHLRDILRRLLGFSTPQYRHQAAIHFTRWVKKVRASFLVYGPVQSICGIDHHHLIDRSRPPHLSERAGGRAESEGGAFYCTIYSLARSKVSIETVSFPSYPVRRFPPLMWRSRSRSRAHPMRHSSTAALALGCETSALLSRDTLSSLFPRLPRWNWNCGTERQRSCYTCPTSLSRGSRARSCASSSWCPPTASPLSFR